MTKADIYKAISDLIADSDGADANYIIGINDMGRYLAEQVEDEKPVPETKKSTRKIDLDMGRVKALRNAGWTIEKIADDLHVSSATISTRLKQEEGENAKLD